MEAQQQSPPQPEAVGPETAVEAARSEASPEITVVVELPTGVSVTLPSIVKAECGMGIKQALSELPEACFFTCFALVYQEDPSQEVNEFVDLNDYPFMENGVKLKMVLEEYDVRKARAHVKRFKELLAFPPAPSNRVITTNGSAGGNAAGGKEEEAEAAGPGGGGAAAKARSPKANGGAATVNDEEKEANGPATEQAAGEEAASTSKATAALKAQLREVCERLPVVELPVKPDLQSFYTMVLGSGATAAPSSTTATGVKKEHGTPVCLKSISFSGWNPPPPSRRFLGDLLYLEIRTLDDTVLHITAVPGGFYVNRTSHDRFDPSPAANCYFSHELSTLLMAASLSFKKAWAAAVSNMAEHVRIESPLDALALAVADGRIDTSVIRPPWNVPVPPPSSSATANGHHPRGTPADSPADPALVSHKYDASRCEEDLLNTFGMDERGALRDWNEDYQNVREMPVKDQNEKVLRAKITNKVLVDFEEAALAGAMAIIKGHVTPINPNEPRKSHVYVFNNIFFSHALDAQNTFKLVEGDGPAYKSALHEIRNVKYLNKLDIPKLYTLATAVIDHIGVRLVAQSIIPGILHGDQQSRLMYGSVESGVRLKAKKEVHALLQDVAKGLLLTERRVAACPVTAKEGATPAVEGGKASSLGGKDDSVRAVAVDDDDEEEEGGADSPTISFIGPVEWKGIKGADGRCYMLDLVRLTPRDPNWIEPEQGGTGVWAASGDGMGPLEDDTSLVLRPELVQAFVRHRVGELREKVVREYQEKKAREEEETKEKAGEGGEKPAALKKEEEGEGEEKKQEEGSGSGEEEPPAAAGKAEEGGEEEEQVDPELMTALREEERKLIEELRVNPNVFLPIVGPLQEDAEQMGKDQEHVRVIARFLWEQLIPSYLDDVKRGVAVPIDGDMLTENLHQMGINVRYVGRLANLARAITPGPGVENRFRCPSFFIHVCEAEMVARSAKHVMAELLRERHDLRAAPGLSIIHFLNAIFGSSSAAHVPAPSGPPSSPTAHTNGKPSQAAAPTAASTTTAGGLKKGKSRVRRSHHHTSNGPSHLTQAQRTAPAPPCLELSLDEIRDHIVADIRRRYRYTYRFPAHGAGDLPNAPALLRRVCQKMGLRLYSQNYDWSRPDPFSLKDLVDIVPTVKTCQPAVPLEDARDMFDNGRLLARAGSMGMAFECTQEATSLYQQVHGPIHKDVALCHDLLATLLFQTGDQEVAVQQMRKALAMHWQTGGFDSFEAINAHHNLAVFLSSFHGTRADEAIFHMRACLYLLELVAGPAYPELATQYIKLGQLYQEVGKTADAYHCMLMGLQKAQHFTDALQEAHIVHQVAGVESALGLFKDALAHEKRAYSIFKGVLGEGHPRSQDAYQCMQRFTSQAVEQGKSSLKAGEGAEAGGGGGAVDSWTLDLDARMKGGGGGGGGKKKKTGSKKR